MEKHACALDGWAAGWEVGEDEGIGCTVYGVEKAALRRLPPSLHPTPCPRYPAVSPDAAGVRGHHRLALVAAERLAEFVKIPDDSVDAEHPRGVRIHLRRHPAGLIPNVLAPHLSVGNEEPLRLGVAVDLVVDAFAV